MSEPQTAIDTTPSQRGGAVAALLATVFGNLYLVLGTFVMATLACLVGLIDRSGNTTFQVGRLWSRGIVFTSGLKLRTKFACDLDSTQPVVYMANHQSLFDIPVLFVTLPSQARMLAKESLFKIPLFGWAIRLGGFISIDRKDRSGAKESFDAAVDRLRSGTSALIFPEGTRSTDGRLALFQRGGLLLAMKSGLPIVPVGIEGTIDVQPKNSFVIRPRTIVVRYGEPIEVEDYRIRDRAELARRVRDAVAQLAHTELAQ